jgi:CAAX protease family protein
MGRQSFDVSNKPEGNRPSALPLVGWFAVALVPLIASQVIRLHQHHAAGWLFWDYVGRITALAILATVPCARGAAFQSVKCRISLLEIGLWIVGISLVDRLSVWLERLINATFPATVLGQYPHPTGWLHVFDLVFGLALVAVSEEIIFRRYLQKALHPYIGGGTFLVLATSILFGAYHWWAGLGKVLLATMIGSLLALMFRRSGALWPVGLAHYLVDLIALV